MPVRLSMGLGATVEVVALYATGEATQVIEDLRFSTPVLTPNGDGIHDELRVEYELFGLPEQVPVDLEVYGLDGRRVAVVPQGLQTAGPQTARWDGRDTGGAILPPGVYLIAITVQSERSGDAALRPLGLAY